MLQTTIFLYTSNNQTGPFVGDIYHGTYRGMFIMPLYIIAKLETTDLLAVVKCISESGFIHTTENCTSLKINEL